MRRHRSRVPHLLRFCERWDSTDAKSRSFDFARSSRFANDLSSPGPSSSGMTKFQDGEAEVSRDEKLEANYRRMRSAITMTAGVVRCLISASSWNLSRTHVAKSVFCSEFSSDSSALTEPDFPRPVRRGLRLFADQIRRSEFASAVMTHALERRNPQCVRFHGGHVSGAPLPCERRFRVWPRSLRLGIARRCVAQVCIAAGGR